MYKIYVNINSNIEEIVIPSTKYIQTVFKLFDGNTYKKMQVSTTCRTTVEILLSEVFDTLLTPVKYPLKEVITEVKGILIAIT